MKRNKIIRQKPKIFNEKIDLALLIKKNWHRITFNESAGNFWYGTFEKNGIIIKIFFQKYLNPRRRMFGNGVDYVNLSKNDKALTVKEIKKLLKNESY